MVKVALAGATGHLGRQIVEELAATKRHEIIILSRGPHPIDSVYQSLGAEIRPISYTDTTSLERALSGVHTVISTAFIRDADTFISTQLALLDAAKQAGVKRFVPSEFNVLAIHDDPIIMYRPKAPVADAVRKSGLEYTLFETGLFMNYLATGTPGLGYAHELHFLVNIGECTAEIPVDGEGKVTYTRLEDIARFVVASLDLEKWPEVSRVAGEVTTYNKIVALAEAVRGRKFKVTYRSVEELKTEVTTGSDKWEAVTVASIQLEIARGRFDLSNANLNKLLPDVKPMGIAEFLQKWWGNASNASK